MNMINKDVLSFELALEYNFDGLKYHMVKNECFVKKIREEYVYKFNLPFEIEGKACVRFLVSFINGKGKELAKGYIENNKTFTTVKNTEIIKIEVVVYSKEKARFRCRKGSILSIKPYEKREIVLAAAAVKYDKPRRSFETNIADTLDAIDKAAKINPDIVVASECFYGRNVRRKTTVEKTVHLDSDFINKFREKAKEHNTYIAFSAHVFNKDGNPENLGILIDRKGEIAGTYAKTQLTMGEIAAGIEPGREAKVFDCDFGRVAFAICWDLFFPGFIENYLHQGVDVIINPSAGYETQRNSERAKETGAYIISGGTHRESESVIFAPDGKVLSRGTKEKGYAAAKVDLNKEFYVKWLSSSSYSTRKNVFHFERNREI